MLASGLSRPGLRLLWILGERLCGLFVFVSNSEMLPGAGVFSAQSQLHGRAVWSPHP
jgi:hypothetical protein